MASKKGLKSTAIGHKVATPVACHKCRSIINSKDAIVCAVCKNTYEFDCAGLSEKMYRLMKQDTRKNWKCKQCIHQNRNPDLSNNDQINITRRNRAHKIASVTDSVTEKIAVAPTINKNAYDDNKTSPIPQFELSSQSFDSQIYDSEASTPEKLSRSLDHTITQHSKSTRTDELQKEIEGLKLALMSIENEFENTIIENNELKRQINKLTSEIEILKTLCQTPPLKKNNSKKNRQSLIISTPTMQNGPKFNLDENTKVEHLQEKMKDLEMKLQKMEMFRKKLNEEIENLKQKSSGLKNVKETPKAILKQGYTKKVGNSCIYIFGDQQASGWSADLTKIRSKERKNVHDYTISGSIKPNAVTKHVIAMSAKTLKHVNQDDYVVITIGSNDCNPTKLIADLTVALSQLSNTHVIVTSVEKNPHLNEQMLNSSLKTLLTCFENCCYVDLTKCWSSVDKVHALNKYINTRDYHRKYLTYNYREYKINNMYSKMTSSLDCISNISKKTQPTISQDPFQAKITDYFKHIEITRDSRRHCDLNYSEVNSNHSLFRK